MSRKAAETPGEVVLEVLQRERRFERPPGTIVGLSMLALVAVVLALAFLRIDRTPGEEVGASNATRLLWWWGASAFGWLTLTMLGWRLLREQARDRIAWSRAAAWCVLITAAVARMAVIVVHPPTLSDDIYRYVHDGATLAAGENPYHQPPNVMQLDASASKGSPLRHTAAERVNNPELVTIYLPMSQAVFAATMWWLPDEAPLPMAIGVMRGVFVVFDLLAIALLLGALARAGRSAWWAALYAWHPLVITEIAGSGHQDAIGLPLLVLALLAAERSAHQLGRWVTPLALAALVKPFVVPIAGVLLHRSSARSWIRAGLLGAIVVVFAGAWFFAPDGGRAFTNLLATTSRFSLKWAHFGVVYEPLLCVTEWLTPDWTNDGQERLVRAVCVLLAGIATILIITRAHRPWRAGVVLLFIYILLAPAVHPWYLVWALVLLPRCAEPSRMIGGWAVWVASGTLGWGYVVYTGANDWTVSPWMYLLVYGPVAAALVAEWLLARRGAWQPVGGIR